MNGAENINTVARTVCAPSTRNDFIASSDAPAPARRPVDSGGDGALATADRVLNQVLGSAGFVDISAPFAESFGACLEYQPTSAEPQSDLPGALEQLMAFMTSRLAADPDRSVQTQARVPPEAAARLLT
jgi:hypothetical protein